MNSFSSILIDWYNKEKRDLPWRKTKDPYKIWLSEIILQQTRVDQGLSYYERFITHYPKVEDLAATNQDEILRLWQGLGYYSRARNLHFTAQHIVNELKGEFPNSYKEIIKLKGVGEYTAAAIASFSFKEPVPVLDGNVFRVIARCFGIKNDIAQSSSRKIFIELLNELIDTKRPDTFNQAIMEFGAMQCTPKKPNCNSCTISHLCYAFKHQKQNELPVKIKKIKRKSRFFNYYLLTHQNKIKLSKRGEADIWAGLYEFELIESTTSLLDKTPHEITSEAIKIHAFEPEKKHVLSHQDIFSQFTIVKVKLPISTSDFYSLDEIEQLPKPIQIEKFIQREFSKIIELVNVD